jgi:hypothetical protein
MSDSVNLWGLPLHEWAAGGCEVAAIFVGALVERQLADATGALTRSDARESFSA